MRQHREVSPARRWQPWVYFILVAIFVAAWVVLLVDVARL
jgi:hypothetical protein